MKRLILKLILLVMPLIAAAQTDDMTKHLPANWGGWVNLSCSVNDTTYYTSDLLPMQAAVSGKTLHVFWPDWKPNTQGEYCIYYRRSTDAGRTWENARAIVKSKSMNVSSGGYLVQCIGGNSKWYDVQGQNVRLLTVVRSDNDQNDELLYTYSHDGGKTFQQRKVADGSLADGHYFYYRPHVVSDGQTLVIAFQQSRFNNSDYRTRVLTSFDGGNTFTDKLIDTVNTLGDVQVSGRRWALLSNHTDLYNGDGNVYLSTSSDGGNTISTRNIAPILKDGKSWCDMNYMAGLNGQSYNYHPQMTLEGDVINVLFRGCIDKDEENPGYSSSRAHTVFRRSTDGGKKWSEAMYLPGSSGTWGAIAAKGQHIYVLQTPNGPKMWHSHDGGKTWDVQERCYWSGRYDGFANFFELYIAPDDPTGQHVYMTGVRGLLVESKDGFRTVHRNFAIGAESWDYKNWNNNSFTVLMDSEGTEHWLMHYSSPYKPFESYFWNIVYRRNDSEPAIDSKNMALDISEVVDQPINRPMTNLTIPMTPSLMDTQEATTVECWVKVDKGNSFQIACLTNDNPTYEGSRFYGGWYIDVASDYSDFFSFEGGVCTELSVDGAGKTIWDRWRYQNKEWGLWHHVALTYDSKVEKDNVRLYADGLLIGTATEQGKLRIGNNPIVIGREANRYEPKGLVDNFAIYSRALTQEEIQQHLYNLPDANDKDCRLLLTFDGSLQDKSKYKNHPVPLMNAILVEHDGIRAPHPDFTLTKDVTGQTIYMTDITKDGETYQWIKPDPWALNDPGRYSTSQKRHEKQDCGGHPGVYNYWLVAKGTGDCNACAAITKSIMVGGLSRVYPDKAGQADGVRLHIQGGYELTYSNKPRVLLKQGTTEIEGQWDVDYGYDAAKATSIDDLAPAVFNLAQAKTGKYDVIVGNDTLYQGFTLEQGEEPAVWVQVNGRGAGLWGKYQRYTIDYGNKSNTAAYNTPMFLIIPDRHGTVDVQFDFDFELCNPALDDYGQQIARQLGDHLMAYDNQAGDSIRIYSFFIPYIGPNSTNQYSFRIKMTSDSGIADSNMKIGYWIEQPWGPYDPDAPNPYNMNDTRAPYTMEQGECVANEIGKAALETVVSVIPGIGCMYALGKTYHQTFDRKAPPGTFLGNCISSVFSCAADAIPGSMVVFAAFNLASLAWTYYSAGSSAKGCLNGDPNSINHQGRGSYDPNEMIGPWGHDDTRHYIKPIHNMAYTVTFENKASATAPAHEVFVTDTLDATKYDLSTFGFSSFGWADTTLVVGGSRTQEFTRDIIYNVKGQDILVRVSGQYDATTGIARWSFVSLQKNGNEIEDPDLGFLVPNNDNRDGEGFVSFCIEHKKNPKNGTTVSNRATIVFDANAPIMTNNYVNTFDTDYPTSKITKVEEQDGKLVVTIKGNDTTSGIDAFNLFAFKNGSTEPELLANVNVESAEGDNFQSPTVTITVDAEPGTTYGLCVLATDRVGWNEPKSLRPEQEITTSGTSIKTYELSVADAGYATFYDSKYNYQLPAALKASTVSGTSGNRLTYKALTGGIVPRGTAVLIEATPKKAATYTLTSTTSAGGDLQSPASDNLLHGSDDATTVTAGGNMQYLFYKLAYGPSGTSLANRFGWFWGAQDGTPFHIEGHHAWLALPKADGARAYLIDEEGTSISETVNSELSNSKCFDLQGRPVENPTQSGIYIHNGRIIVVK